MREITQPTSSIDLSPTLLALAGYDQDELRSKLGAGTGASNLSVFVGADLSAHIKGKREGYYRI